MHPQKNPSSDWAYALVSAIAAEGRACPTKPDSLSVEIFQHYFDDSGHRRDMGRRDKACSRLDLLKCSISTRCKGCQEIASLIQSYRT